MGSVRQTDLGLDEALESAAELCRRALADYRGGVIDEAELRCLLYRTGLVQWPDQAWLLDLKTGRWWRYDGVVLRDGGERAQAAVTRLLDVIAELADGTTASRE
ncbi:MAG TPA: hypothetical protein VFH58_00380 [Acidimicrobiales bacterium]|nr:hypothetical protein [Acidimicrobiales bacterium]